MNINQPLEQTSLKLLEKIEPKAQTYNGRINIMGQTSPSNTSAINTDYQRGHQHNQGYENPLTGLWSDNLLSKTFFCSKNVQILQNGIRYGVYKLSNGRYIIDEQDVTDLHIIMRSIFLEYSSNMETNITEQIQALNNLVLEYCVPNVFQEVESYIKYKNDVSTLPVPPSRPALVTSKGDKVLEMSNRWFHPPPQMTFSPNSPLPSL